MIENKLNKENNELKEDISVDQVKWILSNLYVSGKIAVFRELIQNANAACEIRSRLDENYNINQAKIEIHLYPSERRVIIRDNGIGMTFDEWKKYFRDYGTGGNRRFNDIGGKFGIGSKALNVITEIYILKSQSAKPNTKSIAFAKKHDTDFFTKIETNEKIPIGTEIEFILLKNSELEFDKISMECLKTSTFLRPKTKIITYDNTGSILQVSESNNSDINLYIDKAIKNKIHKVLHINNKYFEFCCDVVGCRSATGLLLESAAYELKYGSYMSKRKEKYPQYDIKPGEIKILLARIPVENYQTDIPVLYNAVLNIKHEHLVDIAPTRDGIIKNDKFNLFISDITNKIAESLYPFFSKFSIKQYLKDIIDYMYKHNTEYIPPSIKSEYSNLISIIMDIKNGLPDSFFNDFFKITIEEILNISNTANCKNHMAIYRAIAHVFDFIENSFTKFETHEIKKPILEFPKLEIIELVEKITKFSANANSVYYNTRNTTSNIIEKIFNKNIIKDPTYDQVRNLYGALNKIETYTNENEYIIKAILSSNVLRTIPLPTEFETARILLNHAYTHLPWSEIQSIYQYSNIKNTNKYIYYTRKSKKIFLAQQEGYEVQKIKEHLIPLMKVLKIKSIHEIKYKTELLIENKEISLWRGKIGYKSIPLKDINDQINDNPLITLSPKDKIKLSTLKDNVDENTYIVRAKNNKILEWIQNNIQTTYDFNDYLLKKLPKAFKTNYGELNIKNGNLKNLENKIIIIGQFTYPELIKYAYNKVFINTTNNSDTFLLKTFLENNKKLLLSSKIIYDENNNCDKILLDTLNKQYENINYYQKYKHTINIYPQLKNKIKIQLMLLFITLEFKDNLNEKIWKYIHKILSQYTFINISTEEEILNNIYYPLKVISSNKSY